MSKKPEPTLSQQALTAQQERDLEVSKKMEGTEAGDIWNEIKDKPISMFALPNQRVHMHCHPLAVEPTRLYLLTNSSSVLPSLEGTLGHNFTVELASRYLIVSRVNPKK